MVKHFMIKMPGWAYAGDFYASTEAEARAACRTLYKLQRLPKGTEVWEC